MSSIHTNAPAAGLPAHAKADTMKPRSYLNPLCLLLLAWLGIAATLHAQTTTNWSDNFESPTVWNNWSVDNGVWEIGTPTTGPAIVNGYRTHEGTNCAATVLNGNYPASTSSRLIRTTPFVVPSASQNPRLQFWHWYQFSGGSYGVVQIKYGTNTWADLSPRYSGTGGGVWTRPVVDLKVFAGKAVQIAFQIAADGSVNDGWDVDEVSVVKGDYAVGFTNGLTESFELGLGDWAADKGTWQVVSPTSGPPTNALGSRAFTGTNCVGLALTSGNYPPNVNSRFTSPPLTVPAANQNPRLRFWHWYSIGGGDYASVEIKPVGSNTWTTISTEYGDVGSLNHTPNGGGVWTRPSLDLGQFAGQSVQIAFHFTSDPGSAVAPNAGWFVDDVALVTGTPVFNNPEGFEGGLGDWATDRGTWQVVNPMSGPPTNALGSRAFSGSNCVGLALTSGNYQPNVNSRFTSPPLTVPAANQNPRLRFWHWYSIGGGDYASVEIKPVGSSTWTTISTEYGDVGSLNYVPNGGGVWTRPSLDLSRFAGQSVQIAFHFTSDPGSAVAPNAGWFVDDVVLVTGTPMFNNPEGFEGGLGDWATDRGTWQVVSPTTGPPTNALGSRVFAGTNCVGLALTSGNYQPYVNSRFTSPPLTVPAANQNPRLRFWHWYSIGGGDHAMVEIKPVGSNTWTAISTDYGDVGGYNYVPNGGGVWTRPSLDLSQFAGQSVQIAFHFTSDWGSAIAPNAGWFVDDVALVTGTPVFNSPEGFEGGLGDWATDRGTWQVVSPTSGPPTNALGSRAFSGSNCVGLALTSGNYQPNVNSRFTSPPLTVPAANQNPRLRFWHWYSIGGGDYASVEIKPVGSSIWTTISAEYGDVGSLNHVPNGGGVWTRPSLDLSQFAGQSVQIAFHFTSDPGSAVAPNAGWFVDDVALVTGTPVFNNPEGFEGGLGDWATDRGTWQVGVPTYGPPTNAVGQRAHEGTTCAATVLGGNYSYYADSRLISPPVLLPSSGHHPKLRFWHWFTTEQNVDFCYLQIREVSAQQWTDLGQFTGTSGGVWSRPAFDLGVYSGKTVQFAFRLTSNGPQYEYAGWYVDEVAVTSVDPPTGIVEFTDARYFVNEGGTNATIAVERKYGSAGAVDVTCIATDGTAAGGDDFESVVDTLSWADGEVGVKTFTVPIIQDAVCEGNETVTLQLFVPGEVASSIAREDATLVIIDDECPLVLSTNIAYLRSLVGTANWVPTNTTSLFTVEGTVTTYTNLSFTPADELFFMQDGTNGIAVLFRGGTNQFMPQSGDRLRVTAALTNINGLLALAPNYANLTNVVWPLSHSNSLPTPAVLDFAARTNVSVMEAMEARYVSVSQVWISQSGGAYFPTVLTNLVLTNAAGRTFDLTIHPALTNAGQLKPTGPVNILGVLTQNDPTAPYTTNYSLLPTEIQGGNPGVIQFVAASFVVLESVPAVTLSVSRTGGSSGPVSASFVTVAGTALAGADFAATNGTFSWADGETATKTFTVSLVNDSAEEPDKAFTVGLSSIALGTNTTAYITIVNDDFVARPAWQALPAGSNATFSVLVTTNSRSYQWWKDGGIQANATNVTLTVTNIQPSDAGTNWVVVTTTAGAVTSSVAVLVIAVPPTITAQPQSQTVQAGSYVAFSVGLAGTPPFTYQWRRNGLVLPGATAASYIVMSVQTNDSGSYSVVVDNAAHQPVTSSNATLVVWDGVLVPPGPGLGSYTVSNGCYIVTGAGEDIEGTEDRFFFVSTSLTGDGQVIAHLGNMVPDNSLSEGGVMLRDGFAGGDRHVFLALNAENRVMFRRRQVANYASVENEVRGTNSAWLRLMRMGDTFSGHYSTNGVNWELVWWTTVPNMPATLQAGLAVTAHRNMGTNTATFCGVSVGGLTPLSGVWPEPGPLIYLGGENGGQAEFERVGGFKALVGGAVGERYTIRVSPNLQTQLASWSPLVTVTNQWGVVEFLDAQALINPNRFYRVQRISP